MRTEIENLMATVELLFDREERRLLIEGLDQVKAGQTRSLAQVKRSLKRTGGRDSDWGRA